MSDAEISVRLFLVGLAVTAFALGASQSGWRHRVFITALFAISVICLAMAIWYPTLVATSTTLASLASDVRVWFGFVVFLAVTVLVLSALDAARMRNRSPTQARQQTGAIAPSEAISAPIQRPKAEEKIEERIIVNVSPEYLMNLYSEGKTSAQGDRAAAPYIGKWVKWANAINNIRVVNSNLTMVSFNFTTGTTARLVFTHFDGNWTERLEVMNIGDRITVFGQIRVIDRSEVHLWSCELIN